MPCMVTFKPMMPLCHMKLALTTVDKKRQYPFH